MNKLTLPIPLIFIVEDHKPQRRNLHEALERRGFAVRSAGDVATARSQLQELGDRIDVAVLDMQLEDPNAQGVFGTDIGFEIRRGQTSNLTEFLILTAFPDIDYMKNALRLGAAAYLRKPMPIPEVIHHVRSLAFRRFISAKSIPDSGAARRIVETSYSRDHALARYCQEIMSPALESILGTPTLLLCSDPHGTHLCGGSAQHYDGDPRGPFHTVASLGFGRSGSQDPYVVERHSFPTPNEEKDNELLDDLEGASVISLAEIQDFRLTAVLKRTAKPFAENSENLGPIFAEYARSAVTMQLLGVATLWVELAARRRTLLAATSRMCLFVGQKQVSLLDAAKDHRFNESTFRELHDFGEDLYTAGHLLADLYEDTKTGEPIEAHLCKSVDVIQLVDEAWRELSPIADLPLELLQAPGECKVMADRSDLAIVIYRILRWLVQRVQSDTGAPKVIDVSCEQDQDGTRIAFRDASRRLPSHLREHVFLPFEECDQRFMRSEQEESESSRDFLSLYLARALVEFKNGGYLEDHTDDLETEDGHLFVVGLPGSVPVASSSQAAWA